MRYMYTVTDHSTRKSESYDSIKEASAAFNSLENASLDKKSIIDHFMEEMEGLPRSELQAIHARLSVKLGLVPQTQAELTP